MLKLAGAVFVAGVLWGQRIEPIPVGLPKVLRAVKAVDSFGRDLPIEEIRVDGVPTKGTRRGVDLLVELSPGKHTIEVRGAGFMGPLLTVDTRESESQILFCKDFALLPDTEVNRVQLKLEGPPDEIRQCTELYVLPLFCALTKQASVARLYEGKYAFDDLAPGSYVATAFAGSRVCALRRIDVPHAPREPISVRVGQRRND